MKKKSIIVISIIVFVLLVDQLVKIWVKSDVLSVVFSGGNFFISETIQATDKFDVVNDAGEIRFRDSTDSTTL